MSAYLRELGEHREARWQDFMHDLAAKKLTASASSPGRPPPPMPTTAGQLLSDPMTRYGYTAILLDSQARATARLDLGAPMALAMAA